MPDGESREILAVTVTYTIAVRDMDGHVIGLEGGGSDQLFWPFGRSLDDRIAVKLKEIEKGPVPG